MNKLIIIILVLFGILMFSIFNKMSDRKPSILINNKLFFVSVAKTDVEKTKGLSSYDKLDIDNGMLFLFSKPDYYSFWMKDMKFPIDIIYIQDYKIVDIFKDVQPLSSPSAIPPILKPKEKADIVFEINAGLSDKYNFKIGDVVQINY